MIDEPRFDLDDFHGVYERVGKRPERETKTTMCLRCAYDVLKKSRVSKSFFLFIFIKL